MLVNLVLAAGTMVVCLAAQAALLIAPLMRVRPMPGFWPAFRHVAGVMVALLAGAALQMVIWAALYHGIGAIPDWQDALYFSGVTYTSLGYGDLTLAGDDRLLAPLQAASGLMMFGIITAVLVGEIERLRSRL